MMPAETLLERLPAVRGRLTEKADLSKISWFRVGGPADVLFRAADPEDLADFLAAKPAEIPVTVLGVASNVLIRDGGIPGIVIRLGRGFTEIACRGTEVTAGGAALDLNIAKTAAIEGLAGLEFLSGIPGTLGGALRMNAGAYGREMAEVLIWAEAVDSSGRTHRVGPEELGLAYRQSRAPADWIFTRAALRGQPGERARIESRIAEIQAARGETQPIRERTGGSTFKNPPGHKAWELIDQAGCRGLRMGQAQVSELHCNFLINLGGATAAELEALGEEVRRRVRETSGVMLEWEIKRLGVPLPAGASAPERKDNST